MSFRVVRLSKTALIHALERYRDGSRIGQRFERGHCRRDGDLPRLNTGIGELWCAIARTRRCQALLADCGFATGASLPIGTGLRTACQSNLFAASR